MTTTKEIGLKAGPIIATLEDDLVIAQNLRFVKAKRFAPPEPLAPWITAIDCTKPGPIPPQLPFIFPPLGGLPDLKRPQDEDCVLVNVVAPADAKDLPVAVWFSGGGYTSGYSDLAVYDTRSLAREGLVMVNVQYRIGILGYATVPGVAPPNLGLQDQIAALKWVQEDITSFGGDPAKVTIYGQSAGGDSVQALLLAYGTEGLFHQAVIMSAPFGIFVTEKPESEILLRVIKDQAGSEDPNTLSTSRLLNIQQTVVDQRQRKGSKGPGFYLTYGAAPLPPLHAIQARLKERASKIKILIGWTKDDALPFIMMDPRSRLLARLPLVGTALLHTIGQFFTWQLFSKGAQAFHAYYRRVGGTSSSYRIDYCPEGSSFLASHCIDMTLLFNDYEWWSQTPLLGPAERTGYEKLAKTFKTFFTDFVRGHPLTDNHYRIHKDFIYPSRGATTAASLG